MSMYGVDVSSYQRGIDIRETGARFCICKATDGARFVDRSCDGFVQQCKTHGILWGFYHFANSPSMASWEEQAQYFVRHCRGYFGEGIPVLDWEDSSYGGQVRKHGPAAAKRFLDEVFRLTGVRPMIYMSASTCTEWDWSKVARDYALWGAGYRNGATFENPRTSSYGWGAFKSPVIHQYAESGGLDKNVGYLTAEQWKRFANPSTDKTPNGTCPDANRTCPQAKPADTAEKVEAIMASTAALITPTHDGKPLGFVAWYDGHELRSLDQQDQPTAIQKVYEKMGQTIPSFTMEDNWFYRFCTAVSCSDKAIMAKMREFFPNEGR